MVKLTEKNVDKAISEICLDFKCLESATFYLPSVGDYVYLIRWSFYTGTTLYRRQKPADGVYGACFWDHRNTHVQSCSFVNPPMFSYLQYQLDSAKVFSDPEHAKYVMRRDILNNC